MRPISVRDTLAQRHLAQEGQSVGATKHRDDQLFAGPVEFRGRATFSGPLALGQPFGRRFYLDPVAGNDSYDGLAPDRPVLTLQEAIDRCTANAGDIIVRKRGTETVSAPVQFNKRGITVVRQDYGHPATVSGESFTTYNDQAAGLSAAVITEPCRLVGLGFATADISEEALLIQGTGGFDGGFNSIEFCRFAAWNGAVDAGARTIGGALNHFYGCEFDGLFTGFGTGGIIMENDDAFVPFYPRVEQCRFMALGAGNHAIVHSGAAPVEVLYAHNYMGSSGAFLDNGDLAASGLVADNWLGGADQTAMFSNLTNSTMRIVDNHYDES